MYYDIVLTYQKLRLQGLSDAEARREVENEFDLSVNELCEILYEGDDPGEPVE